MTGEDAEKLLQGVVTNDMDLLAAQPAIHAALLTPQGKILFDFFVVKAGDGFLLEDGARQGRRPRQAPRRSTSCAPRSTIADASDDYRVLALWGDAAAQLRRDDAAPSRSPIRGCAALGIAHPGRGAVRGDIAAATNGVEARAEDYHAHRIALGVPEGGKDYALGDTFPHEADLDQLDGVSFSKGCFVGQEVVSRMQNRATVRKRVVPIEGEAPLACRAPRSRPARRPSARVGSVAGRQALALVRLDRAAEAKAKGAGLTAGGVAITLRKPDWATLRSRAGRAAEAP